MPKKNRLAPQPEHKRILSELKNHLVLDRESIGMRHIIQAQDGAIHCQGLELEYRWGPREGLDSMHPNAPKIEGWVSYEGGRAHLTAAVSHANAWSSTKYDLSSVFPENLKAAEIARAPGHKFRSLDPNKVRFYGNAILRADYRMHWVMRRRGSSEDFLEFNEQLTTERTLVADYGDGPRKIIFMTEPNAMDLIMLKMRWL